MFKLLPHQERVLQENPKKALLVHEMRTGKTIIGAKWMITHVELVTPTSYV